MASDDATAVLLPVETAHSKIAAALLGRHQPRFRHDNAAIGSAIHVLLFHEPCIPHIARSRKLDNPLRCHHLRTRAAAAAAHLEQRIKVANILVMKNSAALFGEFVPIIKRFFPMHVPRRTVCQRAHAGVTNDSKAFQRRYIFSD